MFFYGRSLLLKTSIFVTQQKALFIGCKSKNEPSVLKALASMQIIYCRPTFDNRHIWAL